MVSLSNLQIICRNYSDFSSNVACIHLNWYFVEADLIKTKVDAPEIKYDNYNINYDLIHQQEGIGKYWVS